ncbi:Cysteine synthase 2 [Mycoemilia scoparia]|uniref:Cysteine synthase 2 n=1 Tax=Mycoemilia scoparia TaxID=417184 RepID=A0A9W8A7A0_9FUNG|nr:Cysteine synthase 2 [Mycoemilia scoparia]
MEIRSLSEYTGCRVLAKAEFLNPGGSSKDRIALYLIEKAEENGLLVPNTGCCIFEGTSGSTGISLAMIAKAKGYKCHIVMSSDIAKEKSDILEKYGATVERVPPCSIVDPNNFVNVARRRADEYTLQHQNNSEWGSSSSALGDGTHKKGFSPRGYFVNQFENPLNFEAHYTRTGPEIYQQITSQCNGGSSGKVDAFIHGSGTGGTISGVTKYLRTKFPELKVYLADPQGSGLANKVNHGVMFSPTEKEGTRKRHQVDTIVEGIGLNRLTKNFAFLFPNSKMPTSLVDGGAITVTDQEAVYMSRWLAENDGNTRETRLFVGSSSAINCVAVLKIAKKLGAGKTIVTILADSGQRHLTKFWNDGYLDKLSLSTTPPSSLDSFIS